MIEWKGLYANTPYSSANNKTQDDAVVGMQDTIYVTGPGYGGYSANVRIHNASGAVVALIPVSGGGGTLSAPAPVRILDDSTTYSYSLEVVRGAVPSDDADKIVIRIVGGASKRYPGQGSTLADGSTSFAGLVRAPNLRAFDWLRRSRARMWSDPIGYAVWGSSSGEYGSTKNVLAGTNVAFAETPAGFMTAFQQRGADWDLIWNGAVDGSASQTILAKIKSDWATVAGKFDVAILASGFNDLVDVGYDPAYTRGNIAESIQWLIRGGVNVVIVLPFARNPSPTPLSWYADHAAWAHAYAQANSAYPGQIMVADLQENLLVGGATDAATYLNTNVHLNPIGSAKAVEGPSWDALAAAYGGLNGFSDPLAYGGTLIHELDPAAATASNATVTVDDDAMDGRPQWIVSATANLGKIASAALTLTTTKQHRLFYDYDILAAPIVAGNAYMDGAKLNSSNNIRFGIYPIPGGGSENYIRRDVGRRIRGFSRRFIPASTGVTMEFWPGGPGWSVRLRSLALIQVEP